MAKIQMQFHIGRSLPERHRFEEHRHVNDQHRSYAAAKLPEYAGQIIATSFHGVIFLEQNITGASNWH